MIKKKIHTQLSATDLANHLSCSHLTELDKKLIKGELTKPDCKNPHIAALQERGFQHESDYIASLQDPNILITSIPEDRSSTEAFDLTIQAMKNGSDYIVQGVLKLDEWFGKLDILKKVSGASKFGSYHYEVMDTKLSRETKAEAILQLCLYSEMLQDVSGCAPEYMYVVIPSDGFIELKYRVSEFQAYYRLIRERLIKALKQDNDTYPEPILHCDICRWYENCDKRRRQDDHLGFVAGLTSSQRKDLGFVGITTLEGFAISSDDFYKEIKGVNVQSIIKAKDQAKMQLKARVNGKASFELIEQFEDKGFNRLPEPSNGDIFFDLEGDQFYKESGLEYLWGFSFLDNGTLKYEHRWAYNYDQERLCFEWFIDYLMKRKEVFPHLKVYHYASYEPAALKRLMGRYGSKEQEIDHLLRTNTFVDLYSITKQCIIAGIEKYSIKDLEQFYSYTREANLRTVGPHKRLVEHSLELGKEGLITNDSKEVVRAYNQDDTDSTYYLYQWLESLRSEEIAKGENFTRPLNSDGDISEELNEHLLKLIELKENLQKGISLIPEERSESEQAQWLLSDLIAFYRREDKVNFWEKFRLKDLDSLELLEDKSGVSALSYMDDIGGTKKCPIQRYSFVDQIIDIKKGSEVFKEGFLSDEEVKSFASVVAINYEESYIDIKKKTGQSDFHPNAIWAWSHVNKKQKADRLFEFALDVLENGIKNSQVKFKAARDILLNNNPDFKNEIDSNNSDSLELTKDMALALNNSYLAVQGPPGTGKSYSASRVVLRLIQEGYRVGVTGLSHKVISNLMNKIQDASFEERIDVRLFQKTNEDNKTNESINYISKGLEEIDNPEEAFVFGGTDFMWSSEKFKDSVDYMVVDEAGQFSLVGIMSIAHVTKNIILLGDGAQLKQPIQGSHPDGCEVSVLDYIVGDNKTLPKEKGVFLAKTYRLHPNICRFNSELFYEDRLKAIEGNESQVISGDSKFSNVQLAFVEASHSSNTNYAIEEVETIKNMVEDLVRGENTYTLFERGKRISKPVDYDSIKIVAPYNAQVNRLKQAIPNVSIGTVDKFQGQEAPIIIYSVTTSSPEDAPRGMEFLYSGNRLNVAVSRAQCLFVMVANRKILNPNCKNPAQMKLANSYCRFLEMAVQV